MKLWCTRDMDGNRTMWVLKPAMYNRTGEYDGGMKWVTEDGTAVEAEVICGIFPHGMKKGDCVSVTVPRFVADKKGKQDERKEH